jgi:hypothetical protein
MALPKFDLEDKKLNIISALADEPNDVDGLTAEQLKAEFDKGSKLIRDFLNVELIPAVASDIDAAAQGITGGEGIDGARLRDGSISSEKLAPGSVTAAKIGLNAVTSAKIANAAVTADKLAEDSVNTKHVADGAITREKIAEQAISADKIFPGAVVTDKLAKSAVTEDKIAPDAVSAVYYAEIGTTWAGLSAPYTQDVEVTGLPDSDRIVADIVLNGDWAEAEEELYEYAKIWKMIPGNGTLTVYANEKTERTLQIKLLVMHGSGLGSGGSGSEGESSATVNGVNLVDRTTGAAYTLYVNDGKLTLA